MAKRNFPKAHRESAHALISDLCAKSQSEPSIQVDQREWLHCSLPAKDWASSVRIPPSQQDSSRQLTGWRVEFPDEHKKASVMSIQRIRWGAAVGGALLAEVAQVIAAVLWVAIYSHVLNPGQPMTVYEQHAQASGPWVSIIAGFPIFYFASRWMARSLPTALALFCKCMKRKKDGLFDRDSPKTVDPENEGKAV